MKINYNAGCKLLILYDVPSTHKICKMITLNIITHRAAALLGEKMNEPSEIGVTLSQPNAYDLATPGLNIILWTHIFILCHTQILFL